MLNFQTETHKRRERQDYFNIHYETLDRLEQEGLVVDASGLEVTLVEDKFSPVLVMKGRIQLTCNMHMSVSKRLWVYKQKKKADGPDIAFVETFAYSYMLVGANDKPIFRYCSPHDDEAEPGAHKPFHHKHVFDKNGKQLHVEPIVGEWPTLGEVLEEAREHAPNQII